MWRKIVANKKLLWTLIYVGSLFLTMFFSSIYSGTDFYKCLAAPECNFVVSIGINFISFPAGLIWLSFLNIAYYLFDFYFSKDMLVLSFLLSTAGCYLLGYFQWFKVIPWIFVKIRRRLIKG